MERKMYINGASAISIQKPLTDEGIFNPIKSDGKFVKCLEPDYKEFIAPLAARRMSPIVKRAIATSMRALKEAKVDVPDAIINGTGIGCTRARRSGCPSRRGPRRSRHQSQFRPYCLSLYHSAA